LNITILSVDIKTVPTAKGSYQSAEVAYKNNTFQGKVEGKKVMSFGATASSFKTLATAQPGDSFTVEVIKNAAGYNDWVSMTKAGAEAGDAPKETVSLPKPAMKTTYETPEERAQRQVLIVRQSSISAAVSTLTAGAKTTPKSTDVIALAKEYEAYVFGVKSAGPSGFEDLPDFGIENFPKVD
jgi:hypothetical protein